MNKLADEILQDAEITDDNFKFNVIQYLTDKEGMFSTKEEVIDGFIHDKGYDDSWVGRDLLEYFEVGADYSGNFDETRKPA